MTIYTFGDSHSGGNAWAGLSTQYHLGPMLCYTFGYHKNRFDINNFKLENGDTVIFCLGEIDCRCHIKKHVSDTKTYQEIIDDIVYNYFESIKMNIINSQITFKNVCVYNVVPPIQKHNTSENPEFPFDGTDEERRDYVLYFNKKYKEKCSEYNFIFFDIYDKYIDNNGFLRKDMSDDNVHINNGTHISDFINENNI